MPNDNANNVAIQFSILRETLEHNFHKLKKTPGKPRIVIVGAGIGGLMLATRLARKYRRKQSLEVYLVDRAPVHVWKPMLHTFASGTSHSAIDGLPLISQAKNAGFRFLPGEFFVLDTDRKSVSLRLANLPGKSELKASIEYDLLVFAMGSRANDFGVAGVQKHCEFIDTLWHAERLNSKLKAELAHSVVANSPVRIVIVGGGATGVEFAADIAALRDIGSSYGASNLHDMVSVTLLDSGSRVLSAFSEDVSHKVEAKLRDARVTVKNNVRVQSVDADGFNLASGDTIRATLKVWAAGVAAPKEIKSGTELALSTSGQIQVDKYLNTSHSDVFAIGDCALFTNAEEPDQLLPPTGQVARQQADYLFKSLPLHLSGSKAKPFHFKDMGSLVSLSHYGAFGELNKKGFMPAIALKGFIAHRAHRLFYRMHQIGLYGGLRGAIIFLRDGLNDLVKPKIRMD
ncbi:MAG: NAD(P)/FAD-dependent oxidoreductase [Pseudomonadota bacterium]